MSTGASVLDGQLTRTWKYPVHGRNHVINLYHDTITGVRSVMVDFEEVYGSMGNSSLVMEATGHQIPFNLPGDLQGHIGINRHGFFGFEYSCFVIGQQIKEVTDDLKNVEGPTYETEVCDTISTPPIDDSGQQVVFYVLRVTRVSDRASTIVHRRFRDFADMNSQVKQNLKGHQIWTSLPALPDKTLKFLVDHNDPAFITERKEGLHTFLGMMVNLPHVNEMTCVKGFLGLMDKVTEYSVVFYTPQLGLSIDPGASVKISSIQNTSLCPGVKVGDSLSKLAGQPVAGTSFNAIVNYLRTYPRPLIVHFIRMAGNKGEDESGGKGRDDNFAENVAAVPPAAAATTATATSAKSFPSANASARSSSTSSSSSSISNSNSNKSGSVSAAGDAASSAVSTGAATVAATRGGAAKTSTPPHASLRLAKSPLDSLSPAPSAFLDPPSPAKAMALAPAKVSVSAPAPISVAAPVAPVPVDTLTATLEDSSI